MSEMVVSDRKAWASALVAMSLAIVASYSLVHLAMIEGVSGRLNDGLLLALAMLVIRHCASIILTLLRWAASLLIQNAVVKLVVLGAAVSAAMLSLGLVEFAQQAVATPSTRSVCCWSGRS